MEAPLSLAELNAAAFRKFISQPVNQTVIRFLADSAFSVITCDNSPIPAPITRVNKAPTTSEPQRMQADGDELPTLEQFITQLVNASKVPAPTLMSTLVYLTRLRSLLPPMARGFRCTTHRIFLAALILAAKYLNDSSPKNKHWASYSLLATDAYTFGFSLADINVMERELLFLLNWDLRIREEDIYRELDPFLAPIRDEIELKHARRTHHRRRHHYNINRPFVAAPGLQPPLIRRRRRRNSLPAATPFRRRNSLPDAAILARPFPVPLQQPLPNSATAAQQTVLLMATTEWFPPSRYMNCTIARTAVGLNVLRYTRSPEPLENLSSWQP